ncbi:MAG: ABC transporter ATP-binding protein [Clostridia bacterium]|nr:ABC transporter ATP-binding protein [Clostridia bacterium]
MGKNTQFLKRWWSTSKPSKLILFFQWLTACIPSIITVVQAVPAAKAITCITVADYKGTMIWLCVVFALTLLSQISWQIQYSMAGRQLNYIYPRIQERLFSKIFNADDMNFKYTSKEKMINTITNNITVLSDFCDYLAYKSAYLIESIITFVIIFTYNIYIGLAIFAIAILVYFMINAVNTAIGKKSLKIQEEKDSLTETFADMVDGRKLSTDLNIKNNLHEKYFKKVDTLMGLYRKRINLQSLRDNWIYIFYTFIILLATLYLVHLVSADTLTTTLYLILTPYLTSAITKLVNFFSIFNDLQNANISSLRVKTLLDMSEKDMIEFGNNSTDKIDGAVTFSNVSYTSSGKIDKSLGNINTFNAQIVKNDIVLFQGEKNCGKRALFYMLRRAVRPDEGTITFDTINIYDFDVETYKHNISYVTNKPYFFNDSIFENLKYVESNKKKIYETCKKVGIYDKIMQLPEGFQTNLSKQPTALSQQDKFLLGLVRALLTKSEIFMIYEFPVGLNQTEQNTIKEILLTLKKERTILIFSALNPVEEIIDRHFLIEKGNIKEQQRKK